MSDRFDSARRDVWHHARRMWEAGLVVAAAGNVSRRVDGEPGLVAITPTQVPYETLAPQQIVIVDAASGRPVESAHAPSYELPMHLVVYARRPDVAAIVHTHAPFVTTLSVLRRPLPPVIDEMVVHFGGTIEVAEYSFTGTEALGENLVRALGDRSGAMLANHGNVCIGPTLAEALRVAVTMESCARVYVQALQTGEPVPLSDDAVRAGLALRATRAESRRRD
jgi:L-fuculose-phosphate aldolase